VKRILLTNDDGIHSPGLEVLKKELSELGRVTVIVPANDRSTVSHSITLRHPLRITRIKEDVFTTTGTPSDCVIIAIFDIFRRKPDLVVSGINKGPNLGDDITYSGTVAASIEATLRGVASFAISVASFKNCRYDVAGRFGRKLAEYIFEKGLPQDTFLNVNIPNVPLQKIKGVRITHLGRRIYRDKLIRRKDPHGEIYYWLGGEKPTDELEPGTDCSAVRCKYISVTPVHLDLTNYRALDILRKWRIKFP